MLDLEKFRALLRSYEGDEEATAFLLSCARAFMEYAHAVYNRELALYAYGQEQLEPEVMRATMKELDNAVAAAQELELANGAGLKRMAAKLGMPIVYREAGAGAAGQTALCFVQEVLAAQQARQ